MTLRRAFFAGSSLRSLAWFPSVVVWLQGGRKRGKGSKKPPAQAGNNNNNLHFANDLFDYAIFNHLLDSAVF
jgi:hypothetical protein